MLTYYSDETEEFSDAHLRRLRDSGLTEDDIAFEVCPVRPPVGCEYWSCASISAPIVKKAATAAIL